MKKKSGKTRLTIFWTAGFLSLTCLLMASSRPVMAQDLSKLNRFLQSTSSPDASKKFFLEGRDLVQEEKWAEAAGRFDEFIRKYPGNSNTDAAFYWLAFSLKKEEEFLKAFEIVDRLVKEYPKSTWVEDAKAMMIEIAPHLGKGETIIQGMSNDSDELKITALVSLAETNPARAAGFASDILKPDSKASPRLKESAINVLGQRSDRQTLDLLTNIARGPGETRLRRAAIFALARSSDDSVLDLLKQLATTPDASGVNRFAVFAIAESDNPRAEVVLREVLKSSPSPAARRAAIQALARKGGAKVVEELLAAYDSEHDAETRRQILIAFSQIDDPRVAARISEIARGTDDHQLRRFAIYWMGQHAGSQGVEELIKLYDLQTDEGTRLEIMSALYQSGQKPGLNKLMQIAKSDASISLRKRAIFWLGQSKDPEAEKFIEDLLK